MIVLIRDGIYIVRDDLTEEDLPNSPLYLKGWRLYTDVWPLQEVSYQPTNEDIIADLTRSLEAFYDSVAQTKRYDNRLTCALRAGYAGPFQSEGTTFAIWMDTCNAYGYQVMNDCLDGKRSIPTAEQLISELPIIQW